MAGPDRSKAGYLAMAPIAAVLTLGFVPCPSPFVFWTSLMPERSVRALGRGHAGELRHPP